MNTPEECSICGGRQFKVMTVTDGYRNGSFEIFTCADCGVGILFPVPDFRKIEATYYNATYHAYLNMGSPAKPSLASKAKQAIKKAVLDQYFGYGEASLLGTLCYPFFFRIPFYPDKVSGGTYLDVGCGSGVQLLHMKELGWEPYGVDPSEIALSVARENGLENLSHGTLDEAQFPPKSFAAINLTHVLEHIPNPHVILKEAHRILKDDGTLIISVPNFNCLGRAVFGKNYEYDVPRHLYQFTLRSLTILLEKNGFTLEKSYRNDTMRGVMHTVAHRLHIPLSKKKYFVYVGLGMDFFTEPFLSQTSLGAQLIVKAKKN